MSVEQLHLRKLLQLMLASPKQQETLLRSEVRQDALRMNGMPTSGGDFYGPFWSDVKNHVSGNADLRELSKERMVRNPRRERLYPVLTKGFLNWWDEHRRWTNEPFEIVSTPSTTFKFNDFLSIRIENFLAVRDSSRVTRFIYPYFYENPSLKNEGARVGLWVIKSAFRALPFENFRILDVPRGRIFSPDRCYLEGDEEHILRDKYSKLWESYVRLEEAYGTT